MDCIQQLAPSPGVQLLDQDMEMVGPPTLTMKRDKCIGTIFILVKFSGITRKLLLLRKLRMLRQL